MDKEKQRIAIAEACGIFIKEDEDGWFDIWIDGKNTRTGTYFDNCVREIPDYLNDLNVMHKAEEILDGSLSCYDYERFERELTKTMRGSGLKPRLFKLIHATAEQRAEAFLKTLNLWTD